MKNKTLILIGFISSVGVIAMVSFNNCAASHSTNSADSALGVAVSSTPSAGQNQVSFLAVSDIHYGYHEDHSGKDDINDYVEVDQPPPVEVDKTGEALLPYTTEQWNAFQVEALNSSSNYQGQISKLFSTRTYQAPKGVVILGDIADDGQPIQMREFEDAFGLKGDDGGGALKLHYPVYETTGNHDYPTTGWTNIDRNGTPTNVVQSWDPSSLSSPRDLPVFGEIFKRNQSRLR